jgi:hypothetical protein
MPDALRKSSTIQYLRYLADKKELKYAYIFEMSYAVVNGRERSLDTEKDGFKISNISFQVVQQVVHKRTQEIREFVLKIHFVFKFIK